MIFLTYFGGYVLAGLATALLNQIVVDRVFNSRTLPDEWAGIVVVWPFWWVMLLVWACMRVFDSWDRRPA